MANTITASNGYKMRPIKESDYTFVMETLKDFPLGAMTYSQRINEFSHMLYVSEGFDSVLSTGDYNACIATVIEKPDGTAVALRHNIIKDNVAEIRIGAVHPDHRGNKYQTVNSMLNGHWVFKVLNCTTQWVEFIDSGNIKTIADKWRPSWSTSESTRAAKEPGPTATLTKVTQTAAECETYRAAHSTWGSITYTVS